MGFWSKLGKIALVAAPYVAAPFTGGASLAFTGATNKAVQKWNEHDAKKAAEKGLAPSKFDKYLGYASTGASLASGVGAFSGLGKMGSANSLGKGASAASNASNLSKGNSLGTNFGYAGATGDYSSGVNAASRLGGLSKALDTYNKYSGYAQPALAAINRNQGYSQSPYRTPDFNPYLQYGYPGGGIGGGAGSGYNQNQNYGLAPSQSYAQPRQNPQYQQMFGSNLGSYDQRSPNLALSINQGRMDAIRNQPFRQGYPVNAIGNDDQLINYNMPAIHPNGGDYTQNIGPWAGDYGIAPERQPWAN